MHLIIGLRGIKHDTDRFINELSAKYLPLKFKDKETGAVMEKLVQVAVRPYHIFEVVFPKEHLDAMCNTLFAGSPGLSNTPRFRKWVRWVRWLIGLKPIPEYKKEQIIPLYLANSEIVGIGVKEDNFMEMEIDGRKYEVEGL